MKVEGQVRIPSGCAIAAVISKEGNRMSGEMIYNAMKPMHDRSNGLGGGFAGYGIYPEYKKFYALHIFFDSRATRKECEVFLIAKIPLLHLLPKEDTSRKETKQNSALTLPLLLKVVMALGLGLFMKRLESDNMIDGFGMKALNQKGSTTRLIGSKTTTFGSKLENHT